MVYLGLPLSLSRMCVCVCVGFGRGWGGSVNSLKTLGPLKPNIIRSLHWIG